MKRRIAIAASLLAVIAAGAGTYAYASSQASATINGCVAKDGKLRVLAATETCKNDETGLSWNSEGPQGPAGPAGAVGPQGPAGASAADPDAAEVTMAITEPGFSASPTALIGVSHEIVSPRDISSGQATGKRQHKPFTITRTSDASTPLLLNALITNKTLNSVLLTFATGGTTKLTNASLTDYVLHGSTETWSFVYTKIEWTNGANVAADDLLNP